MSIGWRWIVLAFALHAVTAYAAFIEGEAVYRERIMPPPNAVLVVSLEDSARADAPATELATVRMRLAAGPPYRWRVEYDERLVTAPGRTVLRAKIETPAGLWMTTDVVTPAFAASPVLLMRSVSTVADRCANASTQAALGECAYEGFLEASAAASGQLRQLEAALKPGQRTTWRRVQKAWLTYRTQVCHFESSQLADGSARAMVQWQCAARMTRERSAELARIANCREGDLACPAKNRSGKAP